MSVGESSLFLELVFYSFGYFNFFLPFTFISFSLWIWIWLPFWADLTTHFFFSSQLIRLNFIVLLTTEIFRFLALEQKTNNSKQKDNNFFINYTLFLKDFLTDFPHKWVASAKQRGKTTSIDAPLQFSTEWVAAAAEWACDCNALISWLGGRKIERERAQRERGSLRVHLLLWSPREWAN